MLHAEQIRAARALLGWRQDDLAKAANVAPATIYRLEKGEGPTNGLRLDPDADPISL